MSDASCPAAWTVTDKWRPVSTAATLHFALSIPLSDRPRVLLVDDFAPMLDRAADVLASTCDVVGKVSDGPAALLAAATLQPEIIVLDISLPGLTGLDVAARLKKNGSTAAVVFLTLHEDEAVIKAAQTVGCLGYVVKRRLEADLVKAVLEASAGRPFMSKLETSATSVPSDISSTTN